MGKVAIAAVAAMLLAGCVHAPLLNGIQDCNKYPTGPCVGRTTDDPPEPR